MEISAGRYYKTRDGRKAFVQVEFANPFMIGKPFTTSATFAGFIEGETPNGAYGWMHDGRSAPVRLTHNDLVSGWKEPRKLKLWIYADDISEVSARCYRREQNTKSPLFAIIECVEGDGLPKEQP